jgi:ribosome-associated protein
MRRYRETPDADDEDRGDAPSRTQAKAAAHEVQDLGNALLELPASDLDHIEMSDTLRDAFAHYHAIRGFEARRRQAKYVGKLLRQADLQPFHEALEASRARRAQEGRAQQLIEQWRERLLAEDSALTEWGAAYPGSITPALRALIRDARNEQTAAARGDGNARKGRAYRALFRALRDVVQSIGDVGGDR